jgi:divalent metal cation (Fe/Co/Zn/Cd) transporter
MKTPKIKLEINELLACAVDVNLLRDNIDTSKKNIKSLTDASKKVGLEINVEKIKYMLLSRHQNVGQSHDIETVNRSFQNIWERQ